ncbi:hypothetical protein DFH06DRAFT_1153693 [Mycena polygramma]|nr:hypothetical protein DFH06DRAFT_1153693 [Mycena polygramma]
MPVQTAPSASVSAQMEPTDEIIARAPTPTLAPSPTDPNAPVPPPSAEAQATEENFARAPTTAPSTPPANLNPPVSPRCALMEDSDEVLTLPPPAESNPPVSPRSALIEPTNDVPTSAPQPTSPCAVAEEPSAVPASHPPAPPPPAQPTRETGRRPYTTMAATAAMQVLQNSEPQAHLRPLVFAPTSAPPLFGTSSSGLFGSSSSSVFHGSSQRLFGRIGGSKTPSGLFGSSGSSVFYGTSQNSGDNFGGSGRSATPPYWSFGVGASSHPRTSDAQLQSLPSAQPLPPLVPPPSSTGASVEITAQVPPAIAGPTADTVASAAVPPPPNPPIASTVSPPPTSSPALPNPSVDSTNPTTLSAAPRTPPPPPLRRIDFSTMKTPPPREEDVADELPDTLADAGSEEYVDFDNPDIPGDEEMDFVDVTQMGPSSAASDSDGDATEDNYSETAAKEKKKTLKERELFHRKKDDRLQEEVDQSDEEAFEQEVQAEEERKAKATASKSTTKKSSTKKTSTSKSTSTSTSTSKTKSTATSKARSASKVSSKVKGKQRARSPPQSGDEPEHEGSADEEDGQDDDGDEGEKGSGGNKCGPVDAEARKQLFEWKDEYEGKVEGLAVRLHKPSSVLWRIVGSEPRHVRQTSAWNMFQAWLYSPNGGKHTADKNLTAQERSAYDKAAYVKALKDAGLDADTHPTTSAVVKKMPWLADWYKELEAAILADQSDKGARKRGITAVAREATSLGERAYKDLNLHVCGYIIDTDGGSKAFGSSPAFQLMKQRYDTQMRKTLKEYKSRIQYDPFLPVLQMELEGASAAAVLKDRERQVDLPSNTAYKNSADARDAKRKFIKDRLIQDILAIMVARGDISLEDASAHTLDMKWTSWDDFAFSNQLRLENWDDEMAGRQAYPHRGFSLTKFSAEDIKRIVPKMEARLRLNQTVDATVHGGKLQCTLEYP